jgi:formylglycine-generating enzyme required for sulfatase activity
MTPQQPQRPQPPSPPAPKPQPPSDLSRRRVIQNVGWTVAGFSLAIIGERLLKFSTEGCPVADTNKTTTSPKAEIPNAPSAPSKSPTSSQRINLQTFQFETVTVNAQGKITNRSNREAKYFVEDLGNGVTLEMVQIPGGTFTMGSPPEEAGRFSNESPQLEVKVPGFFMGQYEVTQAQYQAIMGTNPSNFKGEKRPVKSVSWDDAVEFCKKLSQKTGRIYRLPSEAEWEYACRAGTTTPFYFGEIITTDLVNYNDNYPYGSAPKGEYQGQTTDVGKFRANSFGLYDMCGNVWEWCQDVYNDNYIGAPTDGSPWLDGTNNNIKVSRGGSWVNSAQGGRSAYRLHDARDFSGYDVGCRVVAVAVA